MTTTTAGSTDTSSYPAQTAETVKTMAAGLLKPLLNSMYGGQSRG